MKPEPSFVVATPMRSTCDDPARFFAKRGWLRIYATWNRRGTTGIPAEKTRLMPALGLVAYVAARLCSSYRGESIRFALYPLYDAWVKTLLRPGDHMLSSYAYANSCFRWIRKHGGKTFLDGGNSHPENFWEILSAEHRRWHAPVPPVAPFLHRRSLAMMSDVDYVIAPSEFVADSFRKRGFPPERILYVPYVTDLENFRPLGRRPADRPLTLVNTGSLSLRKGTPYLLEAYAQVRKVVPEARLLLTRQISGSIPSVLRKYRGLPIDWAETLGPRQLCQRLQSADVFILPSLEDGFARTVAEALACGLPVIVTPNTGASDLVEEGSTGSIVPICDAGAIAAKILEWWDKIRKGRMPSVSPGLDDKLSWVRFDKNFSRAMAGITL
jgi:glycosyltransferase involved in cell wall biosynthesis